MRIPSVIFSSLSAKAQQPLENSSGADAALPVYARVNAPDSAQISTIKKSLNELKQVEFDNNDYLYVKTLGANPPFKSGHDAINWIENNKVKILYANFSNPKVHACLNYDEKDGFLILINSNYKDECSHADTLAISEAIFHECGHGKDRDSENSIQEELDCMSLNVLAHRFYKKKYPGVFDNENSFLFSEGVSLYPKLFFDFHKTALKNRISDKYGYLQTGDEKHPATKLALDIKSIYKDGVFAS